MFTFTTVSPNSITSTHLHHPKPHRHHHLHPIRNHQQANLNFPTKNGSRTIFFVPKTTQDDSLELTSINEEYEDEADEEVDLVEVEIEKVGKNARKINSKIGINADLETVWKLLTDYEKLADFLPGLAVSQLLEKKEKFAKLLQIGQQNLAFGLKFNAKGIVECYEKDLELLPFGRKRDIEFDMVEGDFQTFQGTWSITQADQTVDEYSVERDFQTTLFYTVHVKPKIWLPVRLVEGRLSREIQKNLIAIRNEIQNTEIDINVDES